MKRTIAKAAAVVGVAAIAMLLGADPASAAQVGRYVPHGRYLHL